IRSSLALRSVIPPAVARQWYSRTYGPRRGSPGGTHFARHRSEGGTLGKEEKHAARTCRHDRFNLLAASPSRSFVPFSPRLSAATSLHRSILQAAAPLAVAAACYLASMPLPYSPAVWTPGRCPFFAQPPCPAPERLL